MAVKKSSQSGFSTRSIMYVPPSGAAAVTEYGLTATGGNVTTHSTSTGTYRVHTFTSSTTFTISALGSLYNSLELLVVAGGGGVHNNEKTYALNGGAGGGVKYYGSSNNNNSFTATGSAFTISSTGSYTVTVGAGGTGTGGEPSNGTNMGNASSFVGGSISVSQAAALYYSSSGGSGFYGGSESGSLVVRQDGKKLGSVYGTLNSNYGAGGPSALTSGTMAAAGVPYCIKMGIDSLIPSTFGGGGVGGINSGSYGYNNSNNILPGNGSGAGHDANGIANSGGGGGGTMTSMTTRNGGSGIVIVRYRIY